MTIRRIEAQYFRAFKSLDVTFNKPFTMLCGPNGSGKSSILYAIAHGLVVSGNESGLTEDSQLRLSFVSRKDVTMQVGFGKGTYVYNAYQSSYSKQGHRSRPYIDENNLSMELPIVAGPQFISPLFIGPNRSIPYRNIVGMKKENDCQTSRQLCLKEAMEKLGDTYMPDIKQWMINRYFVLGKDWATIEEKNWQLVMSKLNMLTEDRTEFLFNSIERDLEPSFLVNGVKTYLEELSSGFKSVLAMVFSIVEWIEQTNAADEASITVATGTVLIDELDAHLHPGWQLRIKGILVALFPHIQFIVTTHSPHVISSAEAGEVGILENKDGHLSVRFVDGDISAWKTGFIYSDIMAFDPRYDSKLEEYIDDIEDKIAQYDMDGALAIVDLYADHAHPEDLTPRTLRRRIEKLQKKAVAGD